jgi:hypothetical protein
MFDGRIEALRLQQMAMHKLTGYAVTIALAAYMLLQVRKPTKWVGRLFSSSAEPGSFPHDGLGTLACCD